MNLEADPKSAVPRNNASPDPSVPSADINISYTQAQRPQNFTTPIVALKSMYPLLSLLCTKISSCGCAER